MARLAIPEQLAAGQTEHSLACPSQRTPCVVRPVGQPAHHAGHSKEDREKVKGETLPAISLISLLNCRTLTHCAIDQTAKYERDCSSTPFPEAGERTNSPPEKLN